MLDVIDGTSSAVQRCLRRTGLAGYEPETMAAFLAVLDRCSETAEKPMCVLDVGANIGLYACTAALLYPGTDVIAFEPTPETAKICEEIAGANGLGVQVEQSALGSSPGAATLYLSNTSDSSNSLVEGFKVAKGTIEVPVTTLDDFVNAAGIAPTVVKIDAECFEPEILRGARQVLERDRPVLIVEVLHRRGTDHGPAVDEAIAGLGYVGYRISSEADWTTGAAISGDPAGVDRDWLLVPSELDPGFAARFTRRSADVAACPAPGRQVAAPGRQIRVEAPAVQNSRQSAIAQRLASHPRILARLRGARDVLRRVRSSMQPGAD